MSTAEVIKLTLTFDKAAAEYMPGETISGLATWKALPAKTNQLSVR